jgi:hypothetical protein
LENEINWIDACEICQVNASIVNKEAGREIVYSGPKEVTKMNDPSQSLIIAGVCLIAVFGIVTYLLYSKIKALSDSVSRINGDFNDRIDVAVTKWLSDCRVEEYADFLDNKFDLVITKRETAHENTQHPHRGDGRASLGRSTRNPK